MQHGFAPGSGQPDAPESRRGFCLRELGLLEGVDFGTVDTGNNRPKNPKARLLKVKKTGHERCHPLQLFRTQELGEGPAPLEPLALRQSWRCYCPGRGASSGTDGQMGSPLCSSIRTD